MTQKFHVSEERLGLEPVLIVSTADGTTRVVVALRGATLLSWQATRRGERVELTDGYRDGLELVVEDGVRNGLLAPFPNRIADARYRFAGQDHDLLPDQHRDRLIYHGFARSASFEPVAVASGSEGVRLELQTRITPEAHPGYPFHIDLEVTYLIRANEIEIEIRATNMGRTAAPYAAGWHPYFRLTDGIDDLTLQIPADTLIRTDDALIPLAGDDAYLAPDRCPAMDFRKPRKVGAQVVDACFGALTFDPDGRAQTVLRDTRTGDELRVWQLTGFLHVFTGDTLARDRRRSIALEPVEVITDAFNRPEFAETIQLEPGRQRSFRCGVTYAPAATVRPGPDRR